MHSMSLRFPKVRLFIRFADLCLYFGKVGTNHPTTKFGQPSFFTSFIP